LLQKLVRFELRDFEFPLSSSKNGVAVHGPSISTSKKKQRREKKENAFLASLQQRENFSLVN